MSAPVSRTENENEVDQPWWVRLCRLLWKLRVLVWGAIVLALAVSVLAAWLTAAPGSFPPTGSPLAWLRDHWLVPLLGVVCLLLLTAMVGVLSHWPTQDTAPDLNRTHMLRRLRRSYEKQLAESLDGAVWLDLGLAQQSDAVKRAAPRLRRAQQAEQKVEQLLPPGTSILQVYEEAAEELLILGEPGAGKSTLLLQLAAHLAERAQREDTQLMPVILPLASWAVSRPPLEEWLAEQMAQDYDVPEAVARAWVQTNQLLPLLDGLDEMENAAHPACIEAINVFHHAHPRPLVVCSRTEEYAEAAKQHRLTLQSAVVIQPLDPAQVEATLAQVGEPLAGLKRALKMNPALRDLATTPLMLSVLMLTYRGKSVRLVSRQAAELEQQVWTDYVRQMVESKGNPTRNPLEHTRAWLHWLAQQLRGHNQAVFYLEFLQPDWLPVGRQRAYTWLGIWIPGILIGVLISVTISIFLYNGFSGLGPDLQWGMIGAFLGGLFSVSTNKGTEVQGSTSHFSFVKRHRLLINAAISAWIGLLYGLSNVFYSDPPGFWLNGQLQEAGVSVLEIWLSCWLLLFVSPRISFQQTPVDNTHKTLRGWGFRRIAGTIHMQRAILVAIVFGIGNTLGYWVLSGMEGMEEGPLFVLGNGVSGALENGLLYGLIAFLLSLFIERQTGIVLLTEHMRWTWSSLTRSLLSPNHLRTSLLISGVVSFLFGLSQGLVYGMVRGQIYGLSDAILNGLLTGLSAGLSTGLSIGLAYWLLIGLWKGIAHEQIEDKDRHVFNQGIRRSWDISKIMCIFGGVVIAGMGILSTELNFGLSTLAGVVYVRGYNLELYLSDALSSGLDQALPNVLLFILSGGLLIWASSGGLAVLRHAVLRLLLWRSHTFPWHAASFLEDARACILVQRVGGGYRFIHRLLLDYFADLDAGSASTAPTAQAIQKPHPAPAPRQQG